MRLRDIPDVPEGAVRAYNLAGVPPPEGSARVIGRARDLIVATGKTTVAVYRAQRLRKLLHVDGEFEAVFANGIVMLAVARFGATELVRWDIARGSLHTIGFVDEGCYYLAVDPTASRIAFYSQRDEIVVWDGTTGDLLWSRAITDEVNEHDLPTHELGFDGDAVVLYMHSYDRDDPLYSLAAIRVTADEPVTTQEGHSDDLSDVPWYAPPSRLPDRELTSAYQTSLAISSDGSRVAAPRHAWNIPGGTSVSVVGLDEWWGSSSWSSSGTYTPVSLAYDETGELVRISAGNRRWFLETCHTRAPQVAIEGTVQCAAIVPRSRRLVIATADDIRLDDRVLLPEPRACAIACADDGSAIVVVLPDQVAVVFDGRGESLATLSIPSTTALAVARGGAAIACIDREELVIVRGAKIVRAPAARGTAAFSPDGSVVAYATTAWGVAVVDANTGVLRHEHRDLPSPVNAIAFSPDGASLFTLCVDGRIIEWPCSSFAAEDAVLLTR